MNPAPVPVQTRLSRAHIAQVHPIPSAVIEFRAGPFRLVALMFEPAPVEFSQAGAPLCHRDRSGSHGCGGNPRSTSVADASASCLCQLTKSLLALRCVKFE